MLESKKEALLSELVAQRQILGVVATPFTLLTTHQNAPEAYPSLTSYAADH